MIVKLNLKKVIFSCYVIPMKEKRQKVITLLRQETPVKEIAEQTGYTKQRIYQIKKELGNPSENLPATTEQSNLTAREPDPPIAKDWIEELLKEAGKQCLSNLQAGIKTDQATIDCIMLIAQTARRLYEPTVYANPDGLGESETPDAEPNPAPTSDSLEERFRRIDRMAQGAGDTD